jgi:Protein of unknown function (DUF3891)
MLVRADGICIGQASHAWVSGQLARAWAEELPEREAVCLAAEQHDVGMAQWDLAPALDAERGLPVGFMRMPLDVHLRLWSLAPQRLFTQSRLAALLVSLHGTRLYERRDLDRLEPAQADAVRAYLAGQRALQERLAHETGMTADVLGRLQALLFAWDWLSLALCLDWAPSELDGPVALALGEGGVLDPWPFAADTVSVGCEGRRPDGGARTEAELHAQLERAPRVALSWTLTRGPSGAP